MSIETDSNDSHPVPLNGQSKRGAVLREFYTIEGDGVARAIPEKLFRERRFRRTLERLRDVPLYSPDDDAKAATH